MSTRQEIKAIGKQRLKENYWNCVFAIIFVSLTLSILCALCFGGSFKQIVNEVVINRATSFDVQIEGWSIIGFIPLLLFLGPLSVGLSGFFVRNAMGERPSCGKPFSLAFQNFGHNLGGYRNSP